MAQAVSPALYSFNSTMVAPAPPSLEGATRTLGAGASSFGQRPPILYWIADRDGGLKAPMGQQMALLFVAEEERNQDCGRLVHDTDPMVTLRPAFSTSLGAVYNTDCLNLFAALRPDTVDCVFADPPFNLGKDYGNGSEHDERDDRDYLRWCFHWLDECVRVLRPGGALFVYCLPRWGYHFASHLEKRALMFRHWIAISMKGTFPRGRKLYPAHYGLLYFTKGAPRTFNRVRLPVPQCRHCGKDIKDYGGHRKYLNPAGLNLTDFWDDTAPARHQKFKARWHVNELKPIIPTRCIEISTNPGDVVLDPFGGGGSTYESAERLGRHWIGAEIVDCDLIRERFHRNLPDSKPGVPGSLARLFNRPESNLALHIPTCRLSQPRDPSTEPRSAPTALA